MQKNAVAVGILALLLLPTFASAAGFAKQSLFLSKSVVTEGDTVLIHAVVNNEASTGFAGTMTFSEGSATIGTVPVSLDAGEAAAVSVSWKPVNGARTVVAELKKGADIVEKQSATFAVAAKIAPVSNTNSLQSAAAVESSAKIQESIAGVSPTAADVTAPVFTLVDGGRAALSDVLDAQIANTKKNLGPAAGAPSEVLGAEVVRNASENPMGAFWLILQTLYLYFLTLLSFIISSAGIFYPVAALLIFFLLWRIIRHYCRPAY